MKNIPVIILTFILCLSSCITSKAPEFYFQQGKKEALQANSYVAIQQYTKAIELNPNYIEAYMERAKVNMSIGCIRTAVLDYDSVLVKIDKNDYEKNGTLYLLKGDAHYKLKEFIIACACYEKARIMNNKQSWDRIRERCKNK